MKKQDATQRDPAACLRRRLFYRQPPLSEVITLRGDHCASISKKAGISGQIFTDPPKPNTSQKGSVSQGRIAIRSGKHLAIKRKHAYRKAMNSTN